MKTDTIVSPNGAGLIDQIKDTLRLLSNAPKNKGYERRLADQIVELGEVRAKLIRYREDEQARQLSDDFVTLAMNHSSLFDRKRIKGALRKYRELISAAEAIRRGR